MKLVREHINEANFKDILKPVSKEEVLDSIAHMSQEEKNKRLKSAVKVGDAEVVKLLIKSDANDLESALIHAIIWDRNDIVKILLEAGVDLNKDTELKNISFLELAKTYPPNLYIIELLKKYGAKE